MRTFLMAAVAVAAMSAGAVETAYAQTNCPVTETRTTGPNGETIIRREACGAVEITTVGGNAPTTNTPRPNNPPSTNRPNNSPPTNNAGATNTQPSAPAGGGGIPMRNTPLGGASSSMPPAGMGGGYAPPPMGDPMALRRPVARIVLFDANNYRGRNIGITQNTPDLGRRRFSDVASTARSQGGVWELCTEPNYGGTCVSTDSDLDLGAAGVDNTVASVRLVRP